MAALETSSFKGDNGKIKRKLGEIVFHFPWYNGEPERSLTIGNMKILKNLDTKKIQLFDISKDHGELNDLASKMPERVAAMDKRLTEYLQIVLELKMSLPFAKDTLNASLKIGCHMRSKS